MIIILSTVSMLALASHAKFIPIDGTYNLSRHNIVGLVIGVLDPFKHYHLVASYSEDSKNHLVLLT
jgi:hypothetical protein